MIIMGKQNNMIKASASGASEKKKVNADKPSKVARRKSSRAKLSAPPPRPPNTLAFVERG